MNISILTDSAKSWFIPYGQILVEELLQLNHNVKYVFNKNEILKGDICFLLSCTRIVENSYLSLNKHNIVVHASDLPKGKGFSPMQWQILEGNSEITLSLIEAVKDVDAGPIYFKHKIELNGSELYNELRNILASEIIKMCIKFVINIHSFIPKEQIGESTFYRKRSIKDDEIDPNKTIKELFNHFRIADNENYPLYFYLNGEKFLLKIEKPNKL